MTSVTHHPLWPVLQPLIRIERYDRDGGHRHPRHRIEVLDPGDRGVRARLLAIEVECAAACGRLIHPIRERHGWGSLYLAVACELSRRYSCARGRAAHDEYDRIVEAVLDCPDPQQPTLFG